MMRRMKFPAAAVKKAAAKKPAGRRAVPRKRPAARAVPTPRPATAPVAVRGPMAGEERVGIVTHYYGHLSVAAVKMESGSLRVGDTIRILGHTSDFRQHLIQRVATDVAQVRLVARE